MTRVNSDSVRGDPSERVSALLLSNTTARVWPPPTIPLAWIPKSQRPASWSFPACGRPDLVRLLFPSLASDEALLRSVARCQRASATPRTAEAQFRYIMGVDVRNALSLVQVPTLVVHNDDNQAFPLAQGRYLAEHIPGAKMVTLSGSDTTGSQVTDQYLDRDRRVPHWPKARSSTQPCVGKRSLSPTL